MEQNQFYDVIIVGAGPAGCIAAMQIAKEGIKVALLEKNVFPRDKICGDALSPDVSNQLLIIDPKIADQLKEFKRKRISNQIHFFAPNHSRIDIELNNGVVDGYVAKRLDFDNFLFEKLKGLEHLDIYEGIKIDGITITEKGVEVASSQGKFNAEIILGADGANSYVKSKLQGNKINKRHHSAGLRQYYQGVSGITEDSGIELHFYNEALPGYLWIFPLPDNQANVGIGMLSSTISKKKIDLKKLMESLITTHPLLKDRFKNAQPLEKVKGFGLPLGSKKVACSGNRYLLLGDAAGLIDPFSGEGIGNAIRSGRIAADHIKNALKANRFDAQFNRAYDKEIYRRMWSELRISRFMQKLLKLPWLYNLLVKKMSTNEALRTLVTASVQNVDLREQFRSPKFFIKLLFG